MSDPNDYCELVLLRTDIMTDQMSEIIRIGLMAHYLAIETVVGTLNNPTLFISSSYRYTSYYLSTGVYHNTALPPKFFKGYRRAFIKYAAPRLQPLDITHIRFNPSTEEYQTTSIAAIYYELQRSRVYRYIKTPGWRSPDAYPRYF